MNCDMDIKDIKDMNDLKELNAMDKMPYSRFLMLFVLLLACSTFGCGGSAPNNYVVIKSPNSEIISVKNVTDNGTLNYTTTGFNVNISVVATDSNTLPANSEIKVTERGLLESETSIYGNNATRVYTITGEKNDNGHVSSIKEISKPITISIPNNFPSEIDKYYLAFKEKSSNEWTYVGIDGENTSIISNTRMATRSAASFKILTYRLNYCFAVFGVKSSDYPSGDKDSVKAMTFTANPNKFELNENRTYQEDLIITTAIESEKSSALFSNANVATELTFYTDFPSVSGLKVDGGRANEYVGTEKVNGKYLHRITVSNYYQNQIQIQGNIASYSFVLGLAGNEYYLFPTNIRLKTTLTKNTTVESVKFASEFAITRKNVGESVVAEPIDVTIVTPESMTNVATDSPIVIKFSENIDWSDSSSDLIILRSDKYSNIPVKCSYSELDKTLTVTHEPLACSSVHKLIINKGLKSKNTGNFVEPMVVSFATIQGNQAVARVTIPDIYGLDGCYSLQPEFLVDFGKSLSKDSLVSIKEAINITQGSSNIAYDFHMYEGNKVASITLPALLSPDTDYSINMVSSLKDSEDIEIKAFETKNFRTLPNNSMVSVEPLSGQKEVDIDQKIFITFRNEITPPADWSEYFVLSPTVVCQYDYSDKTLIITPKNKLSYETDYTLSIKSGLRNEITKQALLPANSKFTTIESGVLKAVLRTEVKDAFSSDPRRPVLCFVDNTRFIASFTKNLSDEQKEKVVDSIKITKNGDSGYDWKTDWETKWSDGELIIAYKKGSHLEFGQIYSIQMLTSVLSTDNVVIKPFDTLNFQAHYFEGHGVESNPFLISSAKELDSIRYFLNDCYKLTNDINLSRSSYSSSYYPNYETEGFMPIGNSINPFTGKFNGNNKSINNLYIDRDDTDLGIFGVIKNAEIKDLKVGGAAQIIGVETFMGPLSVRAEAVMASICNMGLIAGRGENSRIQNCSINATSVTFKNSNAYEAGIGGIVGLVNNTLVSNCSNKAVRLNFSNCSNTGGIVGLASFESIIEKCFSAVDAVIVSVDGFGGIVGATLNSSVKECYNISKQITADNSGEYWAYNCIGGIVGIESEGSSVLNCYNTSKIINLMVEGSIGGICGFLEYFADNKSVLKNCYNAAPITIGLVERSIRMTSYYNVGNILGDGYWRSSSSGGVPTSIRASVKNRKSVRAGLVYGSAGDDVSNCFTTPESLINEDGSDLEGNYIDYELRCTYSYSNINPSKVNVTNKLWNSDEYWNNSSIWTWDTGKGRPTLVNNPE